jgi:hypothetical protein
MRVEWKLQEAKISGRGGGDYAVGTKIKSRKSEELSHSKVSIDNKIFQ